MRHVDDEEMVLHYYGEGDDRRAVEAHLAECPACRERLEGLTGTLGTLEGMQVPERGDDYGAQVWARLQPSLHAMPAPGWRQHWFLAGLTWPRVAMAGGVAGLVLAAFVAGRVWETPSPRGSRGAQVSTQAEATPTVVRERILLVAVGEHLSRSRVVLAEISNRDGGGAVDISAEQATAGDLIAANRLYRQAAAGTGDLTMVSVLEELERTLAEIANSPSSAAPSDLARLREQIESQGLLFKVTVLGSQVQQRQRDAVASPAARTKAST
jgi:hypothetical protein